MCQICRNKDYGFEHFLTILGRNKKLHKEFEENVGEYLGRGSEGVVYAYGEGRALKICETHSLRDSSWRRIAKTLKLIKEKRPRCVCRLYDYGRLGDFHYLVMERLRPLPESDREGVEKVMYYGQNSDHERAMKFKKEAESLKKRLGLRHTDEAYGCGV